MQLLARVQSAHKDDPRSLLSCEILESSHKRPAIHETQEIQLNQTATQLNSHNLQLLLTILSYTRTIKILVCYESDLLHKAGWELACSKVMEPLSCSLFNLRCHL